MEPWAFDSPAMQVFLPRILAGELAMPNMPVARTDDDPITTRMILAGNPRHNSRH